MNIKIANLRQKKTTTTTTGLALRKILQRRQDELKPNHIQRKLVTEDDSQSIKIHYTFERAWRPAGFLGSPAQLLIVLIVSYRMCMQRGVFGVLRCVSQLVRAL